MRSLRIILYLMTSAVVVVPSYAQTRTYAGTFTSNWRTEGFHGHDQPPCAAPRRTYFPGVIVEEVPNCDPADFARGNLDNNIGFRAGRERDVARLGRVSVVGGGEAALSYTEYNLSQADFIFATATATAGVDLRLGPFVVGSRLGAGGFATTDGRATGFQYSRSGHVTLPIRDGVALRIASQSMHVLPARRTVSLYGDGPSPRPTKTLGVRPRVSETTFLLVTSPEFTTSSLWEFSAATGVASPASATGSTLRTANYTQVSASRELPWSGLHARAALTSSAHESSRPTTFLGYDGNYRSKTIQAITVAAGRTNALSKRFSFLYGAGFEVADWHDEHQLLTRDGEELVAGIEVAIAGRAAVRWHFSRGLALESSYERVYWRGIDLSENRIGVGLSFAKAP